MANYKHVVTWGDTMETGVHEFAHPKPTWGWQDTWSCGMAAWNALRHFVLYRFGKWDLQHVNGWTK